MITKRLDAIIGLAASRPGEIHPLKVADGGTGWRRLDSD
jgi:hypothetical protein